MNIHQKAQQLPAVQDLLEKGNCDCILADSRMQWGKLLQLVSERSAGVSVLFPEPVSRPQLWSSGLVAKATGEVLCEVVEGRVDTITWKKDGQALPRGRGFHVSGSLSILHLRAVKKSDCGSYSCNASNGISWQETSLNVTVAGAQQNGGSSGAFHGPREMGRCCSPAPSTLPALHPSPAPRSALSPFFFPHAPRPGPHPVRRWPTHTIEWSSPSCDAQQQLPVSLHTSACPQVPVLGGMGSRRLAIPSWRRSQGPWPRRWWAGCGQRAVGRVPVGSTQPGADVSWTRASSRGSDPPAGKANPWQPRGSSTAQHRHPCWSCRWPHSQSRGLFVSRSLSSPEGCAEDCSGRRGLCCCLGMGINFSRLPVRKAANK